MKPIKKPIAALALAAMMLPTVLSTAAMAQAQTEGPLETYITCVEGCMKKYPAWSLRLSACAADCYIGIAGSLVKVFTD